MSNTFQSRSLSGQNGGEEERTPLQHNDPPRRSAETFHGKEYARRNERIRAQNRTRIRSMNSANTSALQQAIGGGYNAFQSWLNTRSRKQKIRDVFLALAGVGLLYFLFLWITLPNISDPRSLIASQSSVIVDRTGVELYRLYNEENRAFVEKEDVSPFMQKAIVAIEDERFYDRGCLDIQALARVFYRFGQAGGASTLTRQLARNALDLKNENIVNRKLKEIILGCQLESRYDKEELLNLYLNWIPFGQNAYGVELASKTYFGKSAKDLTLSEAAILASLPQAPTYYSPYGKHVHTTVSDSVRTRIEEGRITKTSQIADEEVQIGLIGTTVGSGATSLYIGGRTDQVLRNMQNIGYIKEEERLSALAALSVIDFKKSRENIRAPHFVLWVKDQVEELLASGAEEGILNQGGLTIETTLDWDMQQVAEKAIASKAESIASVYEGRNIALLSVATGTNEIRTYVGNTDYNDEEHDGKVDMVQAPRQPGSSFKPIVYATTFEKGYGPGTVVFDVPTKIGEESPQNFDGGFRGLMSIRTALASSRNIPAIKAYFLAGEDAGVLNFAEKLGIRSPQEQKQTALESNANFQYGWPLALGAGETPLHEMVNAYATFANGGEYKPLTAIKRIIDRRGNILYEADTEAAGEEALDPRIAYEITSILSDIGARPGEYWQSVLSVPGYQAAAKTGTSNKCLKRDDIGNCTDRKPDNMWTMGYTPNLVTGIWIGNANAEPLSVKAESLSQASPIWKEYMVAAHKLIDDPVANFTIPEGIVQPQISTLSGELPTECTPVAYRKADIFLKENAPKLEDPACVELTVDKVTGLLASASCPIEAQETRSFFRPTSLLADRFPQWQEAVRTWAAKAMGTYDPQAGAFSGSVLPLPLAPTEECDISLTPGRTVRPTLDITYPTSGGSATYPSFQIEIDYTVGSKIAEIRAELDGKQVVRTNNPRDMIVRVPRSISEGGNHTLKVILIDEYFNEVTDEVRFDFKQDRSGPQVRFSNPDTDFTVQVGETVRLTAEADDSEGGIKYVQFYEGNRLLSTKPTAPYTLEWPQELEAGTYTLRVEATDLAGNTDRDEIEMTVESLNPDSLD